jgi:peptide/nickel transport system permease protein
MAGFQYLLDWRQKKVELIYRAKEFRHILHQVRRSPLTLVGIGIIAVFLVTVLFANWIAFYPEDADNAVHMESGFQAPSHAHPFGTDDMGRDIFSRVIMGSRISVMVGCVVVFFSFAIGVPLGMIAGFAGGRVSELIMRVADVFMSIPYLLMALSVAAVLGPNLRNAMIAISIPWWPVYARLARAQTLIIKNELYVKAARASGASGTRIIFKHILPNCLAPLIVQSSIQFGQAILTAAALGFIGVGAPPPTPDWGLMVSVGRTYMPDRWWMTLFPGLAIFITTLGFNLFGDGMRDVLDPRLRR